MNEIHSFFTSEGVLNRNGAEREESSRCVPNQIPKESNQHLTRMASIVEVRIATFQLEGSRAPGSDGFS